MATAEFSLIVATDRLGGIGQDNRLLWNRMPTDMRHFRATTADKVVLMGRKTAESIGCALPKRTNLILTRSGIAPYPGQIPVSSIEQARALAAGAPLICLGGGEIYAMCLPYVDRIYLTQVDAEYPNADTKFPPLNSSEWARVHAIVPERDPKDEHACTLLEYVRINK